MFKLCHVRLYDYFGLGAGQLLLVKRKKDGYRQVGFHGLRSSKPSLSVITC